MSDKLYPAFGQFSIVVEAAQSSWVDWLSPVASLLGVVLGAWLSYCMLRKNERARLKQEKLEEIVVRSGELEKECKKYVAAFADSLYVDDEGQVHRQESSGPAVHDLNMLMDRVDFLMQAHLPEHDELRQRFRKSFVALFTEMSLRGVAPNMSEDDVKSTQKKLLDMRFQVTSSQQEIQKVALEEARKLLKVK